MPGSQHPAVAQQYATAVPPSRVAADQLNLPRPSAAGRSDTINNVQTNIRNVITACTTAYRKQNQEIININLVRFSTDSIHENGQW